MRGWLPFAVILVGYSQPSAVIAYADSLSRYGNPADALALYDSVLAIGELPDSLRLRAWVGSLRPLVTLGAWEGLPSRIDSAQSLSLRLKDTLRYVETLAARAAELGIRGAYEVAESTLHKALALLGAPPRHSEVYGLLLYRLAVIHHLRGDYPQAEAWYQRARQAYAEIVGVNHPDYALTTNNLSILYREEGRYAEAETLGLEAKAIQTRLLGTRHPAYLHTLNNLAILYQEEGRFSDAEKLYLEIQRIQRQTLPSSHPDHAQTLHNLATLYHDQGRLTEAEKLYLEARALQAETQGPDHPDYARTLTNLATLYQEQGRYTEAEKLYLAALATFAQSMETDYLPYAYTLNNLASIYRTQSRYEESEKLYTQLRDLWAQRVGSDNPTYASILNNIANLYWFRGQYAAAETLYRASIATLERTVGPAHPDYARSLHNLALLYHEKGDYASAEALYLKAKAIWKEALGVEHYLYHEALSNLARLYQHKRQYESADTLWEIVIERVFQRLGRDFMVMATAHRQRLLENVLLPQVYAFQRYVAERRTPSLIEKGYRVARSIKGILLTSTEGMKYLVESRASDSLLQRLYADWRRLTEQYAFYALQEAHIVADSLWERATEIERKIVERLPELRGLLPNLRAEPLFPPLRRGEALIEVVRVPKERGDSVDYLFYFLEGKTHALRLWVLSVDTSWEQRAHFSYELLRSPGAPPRPHAYHLLWAFVDSLLPEGVKTLYFSPDGVYYEINVAALYDGRVFVMDRYEIRYVATSRRLLIKAPAFPAAAPVVIGSPDFKGEVAMASTSHVRLVRAFPLGIPPLPGAEAEARAVAHLLKVSPVLGAAATESFVKGLRSPLLLHIATHGYFSDEGREPLLEGGILLAQAAVWDSLYPPPGVEDGRLTAREAALLHLLGTELVVLSACESGRGRIRGEGLYGIQRAFLEAGAKRVIAALWAIDDQATRLLMEEFYRRYQRRHLPSTPFRRRSGDKGKSVDSAFTNALHAFRKKYPDPYYWGAFVVMR